MKGWREVGQHCRAVLGAVCSLGALYLACPLNLSAENMAVEDIKQLVVMIEAKLGGADRFGAGIIFGAEADNLYVVTANHVVREGGLEATEIRLRFRWLPDQPVKANLLAQADPKLDLAVLQVIGIKIRMDAMPFEEVRDPSSLQRGDGVYLLGYPLRKAWRTNVTPEKFAEKSGHSLQFESNFLARGHSGGALLDDRWEIVGMLKSEDPPYGDALSIAAMMNKLRAWHFPVNLGRQAPGAFTSLSAGQTRACGVTTSGAAYCWGSVGADLPAGWDEEAYRKGVYDQEVKPGDERNERGLLVFSRRPVRVRGGLVFQTISAGGLHTCGLTVDGNAYCWGNNAVGELGNGSKEDSFDPVAASGGVKFKSLSAGWNYTCGVAVDGLAYCWGSNEHNVLDNDRIDGEGSLLPVPVRVREGLTFTSVSAGSGKVYAISSAGRCVCWGDFCDWHTLRPKTINFESASAPCLLATTGAAYCEKRGPKQVPEQVPGAIVFRSISARGATSRPGWLNPSARGASACGVTKTGAAYCWGDNFDGQLGNGTREGSDVPVPVSGGLNFKSVSVGWSLPSPFFPLAPRSFACGLTTGGAIYCWGVLSNGLKFQDYGSIPTQIRTNAQ